MEIVRAPPIVDNQIHVPAKQYESLGRCIYCGATKGVLTDEHIVPFGLWGRHEFLGASCKKCEAETGKVETACLQKDFAGFRARTKIPLRKRRKRRYKLQIEVESPNGTMLIDVPSEEFPRYLAMPIWSPPQLMTGHPLMEKMWVYLDDNDLEALRRLYGGPGRVLVGYHDLLLARMIAKIAHAFAIAEMSAAVLDTFDLLLPDLILGRRTDFGMLVGGDHVIPPQSKWAYNIEIFGAVKGETEFMAARIHLLAPLGTPLYIAIIGTRPLGPTTFVSDPARL